MEPSLVAERTGVEFVDWLLDEDGLLEYCRAFADDDPADWDDAMWEALREKLWADSHDGVRYCWQPFVPMIQSVYFRQAA